MGLAKYFWETRASTSKKFFDPDFFVTMRRRNRSLVASLSQLAVVKDDSATRQAFADWLYSVEQGPVF